MRAPWPGGLAAVALPLSLPATASDKPRSPPHLSLI